MYMPNTFRPMLFFCRVSEFVRAVEVGTGVTLSNSQAKAISLQDFVARNHCLLLFI